MWELGELRSRTFFDVRVLAPVYFPPSCVSEVCTVTDCLVKRADTVSSNEEIPGKELDKIREAMDQNNYPKHCVEKAIGKGRRQKKNAIPGGPRVRSRLRFLSSMDSIKK